MLYFFRSVPPVRGAEKEVLFLKYICPVCGYVYDEEAEGVPFADLPDTWVCPVCNAPKEIFEPEQAEEVKEEEKVSVPAEKKNAEAEKGASGRYVCPVCGYVYDEAVEGVPFADLPDTWVCPICAAPKDIFEPEAKKEESKAPAKSPEAEPAEIDSDLTELSAGELSALFSNLARGAEKQYHQTESDLFKEIAGYFADITPDTESHDIDTLSELILKDLNENYPAVTAQAEKEKDRGTLRAYTWGNKITKMQQSLVERYKREGEAFLEHTDIWVCTVCGFIYVGDNPPALCPVCKVPDWKFEKIKGGTGR